MIVFVFQLIGLLLSVVVIVLVCYYALLITIEFFARVFGKKVCCLIQLQVSLGVITVAIHLF